jgi:hypothetical protein
MRNVAVATITVAVSLSVAALRAQDMPFPLPRLPFPPPELMVAPIAPKQQPEEEALGVERRASICQELVAFLVRTQTTDPRPPTAGKQPMPSAGDSGKANEATLSGIDEPQRSSGLTAPVPPGESAAKRPLVTLEQAQGYLRANDVRACQEAVRQMRRAGVALPESLIALAALRPELLEAGASPR